MRGKIIKGIAGFYYVAAGDRLYECRAKGIFRNLGIKPLIGDEVEISVLDEASLSGNIDGILERRNSLVRPAVSNIDIAVVVVSLAKPAPQLYLLDRYLISMEIRGIRCAVLFNKSDLTDGDNGLSRVYTDAGYPCFCVSAKTGSGIEEFVSFLRGRSAAFAGPSGVGKSTLTNILCPDALMDTGNISRKIERGKHTTRHSEFFCIDAGTFLCDTPGFTSVEISGIEPEELRLYMPEMAAYEGRCRFNMCNHIAEPDCLVKQAVASGQISPSRYESYKKIFAEISAGRRY